jgi:hypothetical protein
MLFIACDDVDSVLKYQACCGVTQVEFVQDSYRIFIPNCFTPNGDNINDIFWPYLSPNFERVKTYEIYSVEELNKRIFFSKNFTVFEAQSYIWNGRDLNGKPYIGKFKYKFVFITNNGQEITIDGSACAIQCGKEAAIFYQRSGCLFGTQFNGTMFDSSIPAQEDDCFKR